MATKDTQNYTVGRGRILFSRFKPGTQDPAGYRYVGNTPELSLTIESENLDHFSADGGIREKDDSVPLEVTRSGSMTTDSIRPENVALFFFGSASVIAQLAAQGNSETIIGVEKGYFYPLGVGPQSPAGIVGISKQGFNVFRTGAALTAASTSISLDQNPAEGSVVTIGDQSYTFTANPVVPYDVKIGASATASAGNLMAAINAGAGGGSTYGSGTEHHPDVAATVSAEDVTVTALVLGTAGNAIEVSADGAGLVWADPKLKGATGESYVEGVDYAMDYDNGLLELLDGGAIVKGTSIDVTYAVRSSSRNRVISGSQPVEGAMLYVANNPKGANFNYKMPWVKITPNGDYALKGDEYQTIPFNLEILKKANSEAIYMDGQPVYN